MRFFNSAADLGSICLLCLLPLACSSLLADGVLAPKMAALWIGTTLLCSGFVLRQIAAEEWVWPRHPMIKLSLAASAWSIICCLGNGFHSYSVPGALCSLLYILILYVWASILNTQKIWSCLAGLSVVAYVIGLYAHLQRLTLADYHIGPWKIGDFMDWQPAHLAYERTIATMGNPDYFATYLAAVLPLALIWTLTRRRTWVKWLNIALWSSGACAMILTQTRSAWLGAAASVPVFLYMIWQAADASERKSFALSILAASVLTSAGTLGIYQWQKQLHPELDLADRVKNFANQNDLSIQARYYFWHTALRSARSNPLGLGSGGQAVRAMQYRDLEPAALRFPPRQMENVHSQFLQCLAENGWPGLLLLAALLYIFTRTLLSLRRNILAAGLLSSAAALWVSQCFICSSYQTETLWLFLLGAAASLAQEQPAVLTDMSETAEQMSDTIADSVTAGAVQDRQERETGDWRYLYIPAAACVFCVFLTASAAFLSLRSEYDISEGLSWRHLANQSLSGSGSAEKANNCYQRAEQSFMRALEFAPVWRQAYIYRELGLLVQDMFVKISLGSDPALYENAQESYLESLRFNAFEPYTYSCLVDLQRHSRRHMSDALQNCDNALRLDPRNPQYLNQKALLLLQTERYAEGRDLAMQALEICPQSPYLWHTLATAHRYTGEYELAEKDLRNLLKLDPKAVSEAEKIRKIEKSAKE